MKQGSTSTIHEVSLPWSDGLMSARLWMVGARTVVGVPELGLHCYGSSQSEAVFRLFNTLLKYYRQLKSYRKRLTPQGVTHLELLTRWVGRIEERMTASEESNLVKLR